MQAAEYCFVGEQYGALRRGLRRVRYAKESLCRACPAGGRGRGEALRRGLPVIEEEKTRSAVSWLAAEKLKKGGMILSEYTKSQKRIAKIFFIYYNDDNIKKFL